MVMGVVCVRVLVGRIWGWQVIEIGGWVLDMMFGGFGCGRFVFWVLGLRLFAGGRVCVGCGRSWGRGRLAFLSSGEGC